MQSSNDSAHLMPHQQPALDAFTRPADDFEFLLPFDLSELLADDFHAPAFPLEPSYVHSDSPTFPSSSSVASGAGSVHSSPVYSMQQQPQQQQPQCFLRPDADMQLFADILAAQPSVGQVVRRACTRGPKAKASAAAAPGSSIPSTDFAIDSLMMLPPAAVAAATSCAAPAERVVTTHSPPSFAEPARPSAAAAPSLPPAAASLAAFNLLLPHGALFKASVSPPAAAAAADDSADMDSDGSDDTDDAYGDKAAGCGVKRKAPEIDWRAITDPAERRRQRRLAKNRVTAARSRERKKVQWAEMEQRFSKLDAENGRLRQALGHLAAENGALKSQLHFAAVAAAAAGTQARGAPSNSTGNNITEPAVLILIATLLLVCCSLSGEKVLLVGACVSMLLLALIVTGGVDVATDDGAATSGDRRGGAARAVDALLHSWLQLRTLLSRCGKPAVSATLFGRRRYLGRPAMRRAAGAASAWFSSWGKSLLQSWTGACLSSSRRGELRTCASSSCLL